jgi:hypothetical protein
MSMLIGFGGGGRPVPDLACDLDRAVLARVIAAGPPLASAAGWHAHFGRELNATDDRDVFGPTGLPVLEGKLLDPFHVRVSEAVSFIARRDAERRLERRGAIDRPRLGYREVASATNRLTLIAAIVPAGTVTTHTIFCLREPLSEDRQWFLCGVFNSYVANFVVRLRGGTHVPAAVIHHLPVPLPPEAALHEIARRARRLAAASRPSDEAALQAAVARLYGLTRDEFAHVLASFPLVDAMARSAAMHAMHATAV